LYEWYIAILVPGIITKKSIKINEVELMEEANNEQSVQFLSRLSPGALKSFDLRVFLDMPRSLEARA
jgi:hypothetical protein